MYSVKCSELGELLDSLPPNDTSSPYEIEITEITEEQCGDAYYDDGTIGYILQRTDRYVSLSFSEEAKAFLNGLTSSYRLFSGCSGLTSIDVSAFSNVTDASNMFSGCSGLTSIDVSAFANVTDAYNMFSGCSGLTSIDTSAFANVTNTRIMFLDCTSLETVYNWNFDISKFEMSNRMFYNCPRLSKVYLAIGETYNGSSFYAEKGAEVRDFITHTQELDKAVVAVGVSVSHNPTKVPYRLLEDFMSSMPENTEDTPYGVELTEATRYDLIKQKLDDNPRIGKILAKHSTPYISLSFGDDVVPVVKALPYTNGMLEDAQCLVSIDTSNFESATEVPSMFKGCVHLKSVDMAGFKSADNGWGMFANCYALESVDFQGGTTISFAMEMFANCVSLKEVDCSAFGSVNNAENMFANCVSLTDIGDADFSSLTNSSYMFYDCSALTEIDCSSFTELTEAHGMFGGCANLETVHGLSVDYENCNVEGMFSECPSLRAVYVSVPEPEPPREGEWNVWSVKKDAVDVFDSSGGKSQIPLTTVDGETVVAEGKTDELIFSDDAAVTDEDIQRMIRTRIELTSDQSSLDPAEDNFVVWAKEGSNVMTNIADVGIQMTDNDFDDIFGGKEE